ncbi:helix-turn-helix domain-containing protein [Nocardia brasiliensis]|uniref:helix-turn-helix domain-containing protein n=1 Tax=Nocardia brasiliensis TaxID=37326 RepID=UPI002457E8FA|nr:helix-turn-helix transcriptional regulator [Nocardia brasiliensis]
MQSQRSDHPAGGLSIGSRIEFRRRQCGLSRRVVANLVGRSEEWLRLVEIGRQSLDSVRLIVRLADVLRIENIGELIEWPTHHTLTRPDDGRKIVSSYAQALLSGDPPPSSGDVSLNSLNADLSRCIEIWESSAKPYTLTVEILPSLIAGSNHLYWMTHDPSVGQVSVRAHQLACMLLSRLGSFTIAVIAAERCVNVAKSVGEPILVATSSLHRASAMLALGHSLQSIYLSHSANKPYTADFREMAIEGSRLLVAATAAAGKNDVRAADECIDRAIGIAKNLRVESRVGEFNFGMTAIGLTRMKIALLRSEIAEIPRIAALMEIPESYPPACLSEFHIILAYAFCQKNEDVAAAYSLSRAADLCPEEIFLNPCAREVIEILIRRQNNLVRQDITRLLSRIALFD